MRLATQLTDSTRIGWTAQSKAIQKPDAAGIPKAARAQGRSATPAAKIPTCTAWCASAEVPKKAWINE